MEAVAASEAGDEDGPKPETVATSKTDEPSGISVALGDAASGEGDTATRDDETLRSPARAVARAEQRAPTPTPAPVGGTDTDSIWVKDAADMEAAQSRGDESDSTAGRTPAGKAVLAVLNEDEVDEEEEAAAAFVCSVATDAAQKAASWVALR